MTEERRVTLGEAAAVFLSGLSTEDREKVQPEINRFMRWYGSNRILSEISIPEIDNYAEQVSISTPEPLKKLEPVKQFLASVHKEGLLLTNLAVHLRARKTSSRSAPVSKKISQNQVSLTSQGYAALESELASLKKERPQVAEELHKAAADKDFRENAPLDAAREYQGQLEARIRALESTLKSAVVMAETKLISSKINIGDTVLLRDLVFGEKVSYTLVSPSEADLKSGKISTASPIGKAIMGRESGEIVEVSAPAGVLRYQIEEISCR